MYSIQSILSAYLCNVEHNYLKFNQSQLKILFCHESFIQTVVCLLFKKKNVLFPFLFWKDPFPVIKT